MQIVDILNKLQNNPLIWFLSILLTFVSIYLGRKSIEKKSIRVVFKSNELITNNQSNISKVKILFNSKAIDKLTVTQLTFWNNALPTIYNTDIIEAAPLSIFSKNGKILEISVLKGENTPNRIKVLPIDNTTAYLTFDYLDKHEGGIIQIIHTGDSKSIDITRKIKGGKVKSEEYTSKKESLEYLGLLVLMLFFQPWNYSWKITLYIWLLLIYLFQTSKGQLAKTFSKIYIPQNCREKDDKL